MREVDLISAVRSSGYVTWGQAHEIVELILPLLAASSAPVEQAAPITVPNVDWLANVIRTANGNNTLGAGALAEKIVEAIAAAPAAPSADAQDAKRYRWLTQHAYIGRCFTERGTVFVVSNVEREVPVNEDYPSVSAAIDAALSAQQKEGE